MNAAASADLVHPSYLADLALLISRRGIRRPRGTNNSEQHGIMTLDIAHAVFCAIFPFVSTDTCYFLKRSASVHSPGSNSSFFQALQCSGSTLFSFLISRHCGPRLFRPKLPSLPSLVPRHNPKPKPNHQKKKHTSICAHSTSAGSALSLRLPKAQPVISFYTPFPSSSNIRRPVSPPPSSVPSLVPTPIPIPGHSSSSPRSVPTLALPPSSPQHSPAHPGTKPGSRFRFRFLFLPRSARLVSLSPLSLSTDTSTRNPHGFYIVSSTASAR